MAVRAMERLKAGDGNSDSSAHARSREPSRHGHADSSGPTVPRASQGAPSVTGVGVGRPSRTLAQSSTAASAAPATARGGDSGAGETAKRASRVAGEAFDSIAGNGPASMPSSLLSYPLISSSQMPLRYLHYLTNYP
jgi:hypothetical protein